MNWFFKRRVVIIITFLVMLVGVLGSWARPWTPADPVEPQPVSNDGTKPLDGSTPARPEAEPPVNERRTPPSAKWRWSPRRPALRPNSPSRPPAPSSRPGCSPDDDRVHGPNAPEWAPLKILDQEGEPCDAVLEVQGPDGVRYTVDPDGLVYVPVWWERIKVIDASRNRAVHKCGIDPRRAHPQPFVIRIRFPRPDSRPNLNANPNLTLDPFPVPSP